MRPYVPGDDIRTIDWNVTARTGLPHVKRFVEERELTVLLIVDQSPSGSFGTTTQLKSEVAAEICALLAFSAIRNNDKVGLMLFTDKVEKFVPPKKGKKHNQSKISRKHQKVKNLRLRKKTRQSSTIQSIWEIKPWSESSSCNWTQE